MALLSFKIFAESSTEEALSISQRLARKRQMKRLAPKIKIGFLPYLSENGPDSIWPKARKVKYSVKINCVFSKDILRSFLIIVKAGAIIVIPITGTATITANKLILGFFKFDYQSDNDLKIMI